MSEKTRKFVIVSDSSCELSKELRDKYDIDYLFMHFSLDGVEYPADLDWEKLSNKDFYQAFRDKKTYKTAQVSEIQYEQKFGEYLEKGCDILSISCSSGLSSSVKASIIAREKLLKIHPEAKISCIDGLTAGYSLGMICIKAAQLREEGKTIEEITEWIEANKRRFNQEGTAESLVYLKRAGRISAFSAFFGGILSVKPIIVSDALGRNFALEKTKGRKASLIRIAERIADEVDLAESNVVYIAHADCPNDAEELKGYIEEKINDDRLRIYMGILGPIVGGSSGPGTIAAYCFGKDVRVSPDVK